MPPSVRNRRLGTVSPRRGLTKQSRRITSDAGKAYTPFSTPSQKAAMGKLSERGGCVTIGPPKSAPCLRMNHLRPNA
jgi:hypothetical protein